MAPRNMYYNSINSDDASDVELNISEETAFLLVKGKKFLGMQLECSRALISSLFFFLILILTSSFHLPLGPTSTSNANSNSVKPVTIPRKLGSCPLTFINKDKSSASRIDFRGNDTRDDFGMKKDENLVLCDSFDASEGLRKDIWMPEKSLFGEGNGGFAYYTPDNVEVKDGQLSIFPGLFSDLPPIKTAAGTFSAEDLMTGNCKPFPECATFDISDQNCTYDGFSGCTRIGTPLVTLNPVTSGRITTRDTFHMLYGRLEARVKLPAGDWLWPAFWMAPANPTIYDHWPDSGEFDLLESKGNDPKTYGRSGGGRNLYSSCIHYAGNSWWKTRSMVSATDILNICRNGTVPVEDCDWSLDFFTIGLFWSPERMYAYALRDNNVAGVDFEEEVIIWDVNASTGFGPYDYPMGSKIPPLYNEVGETSLNDNPDVYRSVSPNKNAPFDQPFYIIIDLSVGGEINGCPNPGYWGPDAIWCTHQDSNNPVSSRTAFWNTRDIWYPTWEHAQKEGRGGYTIDWVKAWQ
mmetsp:Transcript_7331/g.13905  ORF Transcript_7331/g.13905 Transcript_7331/m.13905 type:complete len:521 (+) Transcript_7331:578-2140(+)